MLAWMFPRMGGISVQRGKLDRQSLRTSRDIFANGDYPLLVAPEGAVNGLGARAGNAALEELVMLLATRGEALGLETGVDTRQIAATSRLVSRLTGYAVPPNKAIVGRNAFAHATALNQAAVARDRRTYEIIDAATVGLDAKSINLDAVVEGARSSL